MRSPRIGVSCFALNLVERIIVEIRKQMLLNVARRIKRGAPRTVLLVLLLANGHLAVTKRTHRLIPGLPVGPFAIDQRAIVIKDNRFWKEVCCGHFAYVSKEMRTKAYHLHRAVKTNHASRLCFG